MDFSENVSGSVKYEPQDAHFSKKQFSLLCTVAHHPESNTYLYHLSDNRKHNHSYTKTVVASLINHYREVNVYRLITVSDKSDNCGEQYKCLNVFPIFHQLAMKRKKMFVYYYCVKGHGKGLVDAVSGFRLKTPSRRAIVTEDAFCDSAQKVYEFISEKMKDDESKIYECLEITTEDPDEQILIPGSRKGHMISYFQSGEIQIKEEICSCDFCYDGNFISCDDQTTGPKGRVHMLGDSFESNLEEPDDGDVDKFFDDDDSEDDALSDMEENELFSCTEFSNTTDVGKIIAIYSS